MELRTSTDVPLSVVRTNAARRPGKNAQNHAPHDVRHFSRLLMSSARFPDRPKNATLIARRVANTAFGTSGYHPVYPEASSCGQPLPCRVEGDSTRLGTVILSGESGFRPDAPKAEVSEQTERRYGAAMSFSALPAANIRTTAATPGAPTPLRSPRRAVCRCPPGDCPLSRPSRGRRRSGICH
jgi:hypothetical protein